MTPFEFIICVLAVVGILRIWFLGSIFASWRAEVETWAADDVPGDFFIRFVGKLLTCSLCFSVWLASLAVALTIGVKPFFSSASVLLYIPAVASTAQIVYEYFTRILRVAGSEHLIPPK